MQISDNIIENKAVNEMVYRLRMSKADTPEEFGSIIRSARSDLRRSTVSVNEADKATEVKNVINRAISESEMKRNQLKLQQAKEKVNKNVLAEPGSSVAVMMSISTPDGNENTFGITTENKASDRMIDIVI